MANPGVILLVLLVIILSIIMVSLVVSATVAFVNNQQAGGGGGATGTIVLNPCTANANSLIQINNSTPRCIQNGRQTSLYYVGNLPGGENFDYVVAPWKTQPLNVCIGFCTTFINNICTGAIVNGQSAQTNFNKCMAQLSTTNDCLPPAPIAAKGAILYYPESPTCRTCANVCNITFTEIEQPQFTLSTPVILPKTSETIESIRSAKPLMPSQQITLAIESIRSTRVTESLPSEQITGSIRPTRVTELLPSEQITEAIGFIRHNEQPPIKSTQNNHHSVCRSCKKS